MCPFSLMIVQHLNFSSCFFCVLPNGFFSFLFYFVGRVLCAATKLVSPNYASTSSNHFFFLSVSTSPLGTKLEMLLRKSSFIASSHLPQPNIFHVSTRRAIYCWLISNVLWQRKLGRYVRCVARPESLAIGHSDESRKDGPPPLTSSRSNSFSL